MSQNLNKINPNMEYGHTDYVPNDETCNFSSLFPSSDVLTKRLSTSGPGIMIRQDSDIFSQAEQNAFDKKVTSNPLPSANYRKLAWNGFESNLPDIQGFQTSMEHTIRRRARSNALDIQSSTTESICTALPELEAYYRGSSSTTFRIDPMSCHLIDQSSAIAQDRKLKCRLGNNVILLNDPVYAEWLRQMVQNEMEEQEEDRCHERFLEEISRDAKAKKMGRYAVDEYFDAMRLPDICDKKPWLTRTKSGRLRDSILSGGKSLNQPSLTKSPNVSKNTDKDSRLILPSIDTPPKQFTDSPTKEEIKLPSLHKDRLSEMDNIVSVFNQAENILQNPEQYSKYTIKQTRGG